MRSGGLHAAAETGDGALDEASIRPDFGLRLIHRSQSRFTGDDVETELRLARRNKSARNNYAMPEVMEAPRIILGPPARSFLRDHGLQATVSARTPFASMPNGA